MTNSTPVSPASQLHVVQSTQVKVKVVARGHDVVKEKHQTKFTVVIKEEDSVRRGQGLALDCGNRGDFGNGGEHNYLTQGLEDVLKDVLKDLKLEGVFKEVHL